MNQKQREDDDNDNETVWNWFSVFSRKLLIQFVSGFLGTGIGLVRQARTQEHKAGLGSSWKRAFYTPIDASLFNIQMFAQQLLTSLLLRAPTTVVDVPGVIIDTAELDQILSYHPSTSHTAEQSDLDDQIEEERKELDQKDNQVTIQVSENVVENKNEEDEEGEYFADFFIDEDYEKYDFEYQDAKFSLYHLNTSATQYDLTGQVIWPASEVLARFLIDKRVELDLENRAILEFGSGAGLSGFAATFAGCKTTVVTDDSTLPVIERLLKKNVDYVNEQLLAERSSIEDLKVVYEPLRWGTAHELSHIRDTYGTFDILIGADTVFWPTVVISLLQSIDYLLSHNEGAKCYLAYVERSAQTCNELIDAAKQQFNFNVFYLPDEDVDLKYKTGHLTAEKVKMLVLSRKQD